MNRHLNAWLALGMLALAGYWILSHGVPGYVKFALVVAAYILMIQWLRQYYPWLAAWIASTTILFIFEMIRAILSVGGGRRR